jgi:hypothetical protein
MFWSQPIGNSMSEKMPDWGVPDWHDGKAYHQSYGRATALQFRWEFLRRDKDYRGDWLAETDGGSDKWRVSSRRAARYGLNAWLENPSRSYFHTPQKKRTDPGHEMVTPWFEFPLMTPWELDDALKETRKGGGGANADNLNRFLAHAAGTFQFLVQIDPLSNEEQQFKRLKDELREYRKEIFERKRAESAWVSNYPIYLRLIDADDSGAKVRTIAEQFSEEKRSGYDDSAIGKMIKRAREASPIVSRLSLSRSE